MAENPVLQSGEVVDATGRYIMPAFCDSHTHLVYAGSREQEFTDKIKGLSYQEIARRGGGILNSAKLLSETSEESLYRSALQRAREIMSQGTGAVEIKSGYGLNPQDFPAVDYRDSDIKISVDKQKMKNIISLMYLVC